MVMYQLWGKGMGLVGDIGSEKEGMRCSMSDDDLVCGLSVVLSVA